MTSLDDVTQEELRAALDAVDGSRPTLRIVAAIAHKNGVTQTELADWFGVERKTIYNWLSRLASDDLAGSAVDDPRPGRPRKLTDEQREVVEEALQEPPTAVGFDEPGWTPRLLREYLEHTCDVTYSLPSCRRLLKEAGLRHVPLGGQDSRPDDATDDAHSGAPSNRGVWVRR